MHLHANSLHQAFPYLTSKVKLVNHKALRPEQEFPLPGISLSTANDS